MPNHVPMNRLNNLLLALGAISFITVIGGAVYEHLTFVPQWAAAPPSSLALLQGPYGMRPERFWIPIHPVTLLLMIAALMANWRTVRRSAMSMALGGYVLILIITAIYFVPELLSITGTPYADTVDADLQKRAARWETLSIVRLVFLVSLALSWLSALAQPAERRSVALTARG